MPIDLWEDSTVALFKGSLGRTVTKTQEFPTRNEKVEGDLFMSLTALGNMIEASLKSAIIVSLLLNH